MHTQVQTEITLTIRTNSLQRAQEICKLAKFKGEIHMEKPKAKRERGASKAAIMALLHLQYHNREFTYVEAKDLVKGQLSRGGSTTRLVLHNAIEEGLIKRLKSGLYSFAVNLEEKTETEASYPEESTFQEVAPNVV